MPRRSSLYNGKRLYSAVPLVFITLPATSCRLLVLLMPAASASARTLGVQTACVLLQQTRPAVTCLSCVSLFHRQHNANTDKYIHIILYLCQPAQRCWRTMAILPANLGGVDGERAHTVRSRHRISLSHAVLASRHLRVPCCIVAFPCADAYI
ncbi:hypothetical protein NPIL_308981 [Nephila pilipes]|uniref:Uncharacterized protein n=1 Tax=Nephila pilipes TaxID=299642 RepID=A0A8X6PGP4_NEPPI|nr:hypothetical protein NPIL_308981 [Nephila pilipes]